MRTHREVSKYRNPSRKVWEDDDGSEMASVRRSYVQKDGTDGNASASHRNPVC